jgi:MoxR-like ATPase
MQTVPMPSVAARQGTSPGQQFTNGQPPNGPMPVSGVPVGSHPYTQAAVWPSQQ